MTSGGQPAYGPSVKELWNLDPEIAYLNHGGYGVAPREILAVQAEWRQRIERNPTRFMLSEYGGLIREAAASIAAFIRAKSDDVVFVENATSGCNAVLRSLEFRPGDEIVIPDLSYPAVLNTARYVAARSGARLIEVPIPLPVRNEAAIVDAVSCHVGKRTRLLIMDHVNSGSGLLLPVAALARLAHEAGARVLIDGAHAPGLLELDVPAIGADWYVGNCHKWLFAPRSCGFLWADPSVQPITHPAVISNGFGQGFLPEFDWTGTRDCSAYLSVPAAIDFHERLGGTALMRRNADMARAAATKWADAWGTELAGPPEMFGAMAAARLPVPPPYTHARAADLVRQVSREHAVEIGFFALGEALWARAAAQAYNEASDFGRVTPLFDPCP